MTGESYGHYRIIPKIGGGMGVVYEAVDTRFKIRLLEYWTENQAPENIAVTQAAWFRNSKPAFEGIIFDWLKAGY